jgi:hypothetical protein
MRRPVAASAVLAVALLFLWSASPGGGTVLGGADPATRALAYLAGQQQSDGSLDHAPGETEDFVLGAAAAGYDPATLRSCTGTTAYDFLATQVAKAETSAGGTAKLILAVTVGRRNPHAFGGEDLVAHLDSLYATTSGAYGDGATFGQSLALLALKAAGQPLPSAALAHLEALQDTDGSWNYEAAANATAGDTNSTAIALEALAAGGVTASDPVVSKALAWLHGQQNADGGFAYQAGPGASSDPDSDALVIQGLVALGEDPTGATWTKNGKTVFSDLLSRQAPNGGFTFPGNPGPDPFTTSQVPAALVRVALPEPATWTAGAAIPGVTCAAPKPTASLPASHPTPAPTLPATATAPGQARGGGTDGVLLAWPWFAALAALALGGSVATGRRSHRPTE